MRIAWVNPAFADYRVPVYAALNQLVDGKFHLIFSRQRTSDSVCRKIEAALGPSAVGLSGELKVRSSASTEDFANKGIHIPYQPGLLGAIAAANPDVVVSEGFFQWTPASVLYRLTRDVPLVIAYERTAHTERNAGMLRRAYRYLIGRVTDAFACNGILSHDYCVSTLGIESRRIVTGAMAADTDWLIQQCDRSRKIQANRDQKKRPNFLYVGQLIQRKGLRELLMAWGIYSQRHDAGSLILVGDGPDRPVLEEMVAKMALRDVHFAGRAAYDSIADYYVNADVFVMPTLEDNWSLVVPEAMSCGLPILCSKYNGCWPELVHQDVNGWVCDPTNQIELANALENILLKQPNLPVMGDASRRIVQSFTPSHAANAVLEACKIALARRGGGSGIV